MKHRILIIGPIGDIGGRELETGFIAKSLSENYDVLICSTINFTIKSQIFDFVSKAQVVNLNKLIFKKNIWFKLLTFLSYFKSTNKGSIFNYVSNNLSKRTGLRTHAVRHIKKLINTSDLVIICAQISSNYIDEVVHYSSSNNKPIMFRTSNTIKDSDIVHKEWLNKVNIFIHHSLSNASRLSYLDTYNYQLIDQCTYIEDELLKLPPTNKLKSILYIGRLSPEKGISELISFFKSNSEDLKLKIIGDGQLYDQLKIQSRDLKNIHLLGFLNQNKIIDYIKQSDAIIIPSHEESGPLVGLEAMAAARLVISTKVGAMSERLEGCKNQFWFDINNLEMLDHVLAGIKKMDTLKIKEIAKENRKRYLEKYKVELIQSQYKNVIFKLLNQTS